MAKVLQQGLSKCLHQRVLLASTTVCPSYVNLKSQRAFVNSKKKNYAAQDFLMKLQHHYRWSYQELRCYLDRKVRETNAKEMLKCFSASPASSEIATFVMAKGGKVKFQDDSVWYKKLEKGDLPLSAKHLNHLIVEGIDVTDIEAPKVWIEKLCLHSLYFFRINNSTAFDDWCVHSLIENCPDLEALDIRGCTSVTDNGLEILHNLRNLKILDISGCTGVKCAEAINAFLLDFCPDLVVLGVESLQEIDQSSRISQYEQENSRYMNWGYIMDHRLGLKNCASLENIQTESVLSDGQTDGILSDPNKDRQVQEHV